MSQDILQILVQKLQEFWAWIPSGKVLSSWAIIISFLSITLSLILSIKSNKGKIVVSLHPLYVLHDKDDDIGGALIAHQTAEITLINHFKINKYIKSISLSFPKIVLAHTYPVYYQQLLIKPGEMVKISVPIKKEYFEYFKIYGLRYNTRRRVKAIALDTRNKKWVSKDGLTAENINLIANNKQLHYYE